MLNLKDTKSFKIVIGVTEGYFHKNNTQKNVEEISELWKEIAKKQMNLSGLYISAVINPSKTIYNTEWGCPKGGEDTFTITGEANPEFTPDINKWIEVVGECTRELKKQLKQSTVTIEFQDIQLAYLTE